MPPASAAGEGAQPQDPKPGEGANPQDPEQDPKPQEAGFDTGDASFTGNMSSELCAHGWGRCANDGNPQRGDVLLNDSHHTALYLGDGMLGQASHGESGHRVSGGQGGDQGGETVVRSYYDYP